MNFLIAFHLLVIINILIISFIGIKGAEDDQDPETPEEETQRICTKEGKLPTNKEYECSSAHVPDFSEADRSIREDFSINVYPSFMSALNLYKGRQGLKLCRRVWVMYILKTNPNMKTFSRSQLEKCEERYNVKSINGNYLHFIDVEYLHYAWEILYNLFVLGCTVEEKSKSDIDPPVTFDIFITPGRMLNSYYLFRYYEPESYYYVVDLIKDVELPQISTSPERNKSPKKSRLPKEGRNTFVNTVIENVSKTYSAFKKTKKYKKD